MKDNEIKLRQKLHECISAIMCCGFITDERGVVYKPEIGEAFIKSIEKVLEQSN